MILTIIAGSLIGVLLGFVIPTIPYTASKYLAIAIVAALDSVFGGIASHIKKNFDLKVFVSGFFVNALIAMLLTYLGQRLNVDIYLVALISKIYSTLLQTNYKNITKIFLILLTFLKK